MSIYLVDGHALAYRSYYAFVRRPLTNSKGVETSAIFGFVKTILQLLDKYDPTHVAVVFDAGEATFRKELFDQYKANRPKTPESLLEQLPLIREVLDAMAIPRIELAGYEADDLIATIAARCEHSEPVHVVSADKDLFQIVTSATTLIRPGKNGVLDEEIDPGALEARIGMRADQFADFQALMGDATDNVPGVSGVGKKTALKLIQDFDSLDGVYEHLADVKSDSLRGKLERGKEDAFLSKKLVTLDRDAPIDVNLDELARRGFHKKELRRLFREYDFHQYLEAVGEDAQQVAAERAAAVYELVEDESALKVLAETLAAAPEFAVDVETNSLDPMRAVLAGISVSTRSAHAWYVPVTSVIDSDDQPTLLDAVQHAPGLDLELVRQYLAPVLADDKVRKIGQNIKYDAIVLENAGLPLAGIAFDTMIASYCLHPGRRSHGLDGLAEEVFDHRMIPFKSLFDTRAKKKDIRAVPLSRVTEYASEDADYTYRLKEHFAPLLEASQVRDLFQHIEMPLSGVLMRMEMDGVKIDEAFLHELSLQLAGDLEGIQRNIYETVGEEFNIHSTAKLQEILFNKLGLKPRSKTKTGYSTDIDVLKSLSDQHPVADHIIEFRTLSKLKNTYIDALPRLVNPRTGRLHTSYNQAVATTGRLSSSDPNLQNIPIRTPLGREIRKAFIAPGGDWILLDADYSQIELRILAHLSQDPELLKAFTDDDDVHRRTAAKMLGVTADAVSDEMRSRAKTVNFGIIYGMGARGLAQQLGIDVKEAKQFIDDYFASYPGVRRFIDDTIDVAQGDGAVSTLLGRVRQIDDIRSGDRRAQAFAQRIAVNTPIQGTAADIIKVAMVAISNELKERGLKARMILQVHDELMFELPRGEEAEVRELVRDAMEGALALDVPLKVDMGVGGNWLEAHG